MSNRSVICIDVGNTSIKVDLVRDGGIDALAVEGTRFSGSIARIGRTLRRTGKALGKETDVILCSVVPDVGRSLAKTVRSVFDLKPFEIRHDLQFPFKLAVDEPAKVGPDRLCAAAGVFAGPVGVFAGSVGVLPGRAGARVKHALVVDIGSAVTVDLVHNRRFRGGMIFAGPVLGLRALGEYARRLPNIDPLLMADASPREFADTEPSMVLGARVSAVGAIRESVYALGKTARCRPTVYVTGGWSSIMLPHLPPTWRHNPHLVTRGMIAIRNLNS